MEQVTALQLVLAANVVVNVTAVATAIFYYRATRELQQAVRSAAERDGSQYANSFQSMLWAEKKIEMERLNAGLTKATERLTKQLVESQERFAGLEQAYAELKHDSRDWQLDSIEYRAKKAKKKKEQNG
jgi:L-fucose isomerase-like protein